MNYKYVLWDFDGTLADSLNMMLTIFNDAAHRHGFATIEDPEKFRDKTIHQFIKACGIPLWKVPKLLSESIASAKDLMPDVNMFPGIPETLSALRLAGRSMGIVTTNAEANVRICLRAHDVESHFDRVIDRTGLLGKPRALKRALKTLGARPAESVYIGDEVRDIEAGRKVGIHVAAVTWGLNSADALRSRAPDHLLEHPEEMLGWLNA
ncbi:Pyrophosphatase PpaX [Planctomycetes bacterium Pan216]|uniref:Pyrophosphatase PpaX n=1 Tax=Kolteria novifilia TaxID=2527975 RepID=A0A518BCQ9_9BACT|nr:Pyrophosphatase PpaX [Planctomycetes bacterium Pan216]